MTTIYATEDQAFRRAEVLKGRGVWPGVITRHDGTFALTHDPDLLGEAAPNLPSAPQSELGWERNQQHTQREPVASQARVHGARTPYPIPHRYLP